MWVPWEEEDPVGWHYPGRKSVGYFGAVRLRDGRGLFRQEASRFDGQSFWEFVRELELVSRVAGRRVVVTGAGGTIGSELTRQIAALGPARLVLVENGEFNLYAIAGELSAELSFTDFSCVLGSVADHLRHNTDVPLLLLKGGAG